MPSCLGKVIVNTYVILTYIIPVWGYLAKICKQKLQSVMDRGLHWACKTHYLTSNLTICNALVLHCMKTTIRTLSRKF